MEASNVANILGALALRLTDEIRADMDALELDPAAVAALVHLSKHPGESIEGLRRPLGLSHSGCVRLADRLVAAAYIERGSAANDARSVALHSTRKGRALAAKALRQREEVLSRALACLSPAERATLGKLAGKILASEVGSLAAGLRACRLCDYEACETCPLDALGG
jgi:DNA-binding MarR family transcriptional regulator